MGTVIEPIDVGALFGEDLVQTGVHAMHVLLGQKAAGHARLVADDNDSTAQVVGFFDSLDGTGDQENVLGSGKEFELFVDRPVPVEKNPDARVQVFVRSR